MTVMLWSRRSVSGSAVALGSRTGRGEDAGLGRRAAVCPPGLLLCDPPAQSSEPLPAGVEKSPCVTSGGGRETFVVVTLREKATQK